MRNWKTTFGGIGMILGGIASIIMTIIGQGDTAIEVSIAAIMGGVSLVAARDGGTGSDAQ